MFVKSRQNKTEIAGTALKNVNRARLDFVCAHVSFNVCPSNMKFHPLISNVLKNIIREQFPCDIWTTNANVFNLEYI